MTVGYAHEILAIDYHLSYYRAACQQLTEGIEDPEEFKRVLAIKDAALCSIALETGIIQEIGSGKLEGDEWKRTITFITRYEITEAVVEELSFTEYRVQQGHETCPCGDMDVYSCAGECGWGDA
jgi:hypothetical protein